MVDFQSYKSSSKGNLYTVSDGKTRLMLECGLSWQDTIAALNFKTSSIHSILCSHSHADHSRGAVGAIKAGIDFWASEETISHLGLTGHRVHVLRPLEQVKLGTWRVMPFDTPHDIDGNLGFLLANEVGERCLFAIDTPYLKYRFNNLHTIAIGCNFSEDILRENTKKGVVARAMRTRLLSSHMALETLCDLMRANNLSTVEEIYLLHLSDNNSDADLFKRRVQETTGKPVYVGG